MDLPPGLSKRGKSFYVKHQVRGKWTRTCVGPDLDVALERHRELRTPPAPEPDPEPAAAPRPRRVPLLTECLRTWLESQQARNKRSTVESAEARSRVIVRVLGDMRADQLTPADLDGYRTRRKNARVRPATINCELRVLKAALRHAVHEARTLPELPCRIRMERAPRRKSLKPFDADEVARIVAKAEPRVRIFVMLAAESGLRRDEILHLQWRDIDFREARIHVQPKTYTRRTLKGQLVEESWSPKNHQVREVYVGAQMLSALKAFRLKQRFSADPDWILQSTRPPRARWMNPQKQVLKAFQDADLYEPGKLAHALRHSFATAAAGAGLDLETLREVLGHADLATTAGYLHAIDERKRQAPELSGLLRRVAR